MWTVIQHNGPNHPGLWLNQALGLIDKRMSIEELREFYNVSEMDGCGARPPLMENPYCSCNGRLRCAPSPDGESLLQL